MTLAEESAWFDAARGVLADAESAVGAEFVRLDDAKAAVTTRQQEIRAAAAEAAAAEAAARVEREREAAKEAIIAEARHKLVALGEVDPDSLLSEAFPAITADQHDADRTGPISVAAPEVQTLAEPAQAEPAQAEPAQAEPAQAEPAQAEPAQAEPAQAEPAPAELSAVPEPDAAAAPAQPPADLAVPTTSLPAVPATPPGATTKDPEPDRHGTDPEPAQPAPIDQAQVDAAWDEMAALLATSHEDLAWMLAEATGQPAIRQTALKFFAAAMTCEPASVETNLLAVSPSEEALRDAGVDEIRVLLAAFLRFGLVSRYSPLPPQPLLDRAKIRDERLHALVASAVEAVGDGRRRSIAGDGRGRAELLERWAGIGERAQALRQSLGARTTNYDRARNVLRQLTGDHGTLGVALRVVTELAADGPVLPAGRTDRLEVLRQQVQSLCGDKNERTVIDDADRAVSSPLQRQRKIEGSARAWLLLAIRDVRDLLTDALNTAVSIQQAGAVATRSDVDRLREAAARYTQTECIGTTGEVALHRLAVWVRQDPAPVGTQDFGLLRRHALRLVFEIDRDETGEPATKLERAHLEGVLGGRTVQDAIEGHLRRGNIVAARELVDELKAEDAERLEEQCVRAAEMWVRQQAEEVKKAEGMIAKLRSVRLDEPARELDDRLLSARRPRPNRFDLSHTELASIVSDAEQELDEYRQRLRRTLADLGEARPADIARVRALLDRGDDVTAEEFITLLAGDAELPSPADMWQDGDFDEFFPDVVAWASALAEQGQRTEAGVLRDLISELGKGWPRPGVLRDGLEAWMSLRQRDPRRRGDTDIRRALAAVLRMLGLLPADAKAFRDLTESPRARMSTYEVRARPIDGSYVPQLGTQANGRYTVTLMFERATPGRLLDLVPARRRTSANLILYFGTLTVEQRITLRASSVPASGKGSPTLVIDEAVIGWLATREEAGFRLTQRVTLPFTSINPYTPFAGGDVPGEVFVGREEERAQVESPTGSMFVYGGRQLGKSALLRRIERLFTDPPDRAERGGRQVALYLDLKSESIGEARSTDKLWSPLIGPLKRLQVLPERMPANAGPDPVVEGIKDWLASDEANRLLLLLDEADMFLTADARPSSGDTAHFRTFQRLKNLMESTNRRFKPVFAGLHQVQRFHELSNTPVAHGGADILIGPLRPTEVRTLVVDPMRAMGYTFESDELVWRVAALTNYQASLVQIFCEALVDHLRRRPIREAGRVVVTSDDVDAVYAKQQVRELIAQRFRWTVNLDPRYRVIALVVALLSTDTTSETTFAPDALRDLCAYVCPPGFANTALTLNEFVRYLDEMVGLGVLHRSGDRYGIRSPNVIALLGTQHSLEQELDDISTTFELPYEYNPRLSRMALPERPGEGKRYSPLTDADLTDLIRRRDNGAAATSSVLRAGSDYQVAVVTGTVALGIDRVIEAVDMAASQGLQLERVAVDDLHRRLLSRNDRSHHYFVIEVDHGQIDVASRVREIIKLLDGRRSTRVLLAVRVGAAQLLRLPDSGDGLLHVRLRRWSVEGLRAWHDFPFDTRELRVEVHRYTSGWPTLLERAADLVGRGRSPQDVLRDLSRPFATPADAREFLYHAGLDTESIARARLWADNTADSAPNDAGPLRTVPFSLVDLDAVLPDAGGFVDTLEALEAAELTSEGWVLDPVVAAALTFSG